MLEEKYTGVKFRAPYNLNVCANEMLDQVFVKVADLFEFRRCVRRVINFKLVAGKGLFAQCHFKVLNGSV